MSKFFKASNAIINVDAINAILKVTLKDLYEHEGGKFNSLSFLGKEIIHLLSKEDKVNIGGKEIDSYDGRPYWVYNLTKSKFLSNDVVFYSIHLNSPSGGINNSHLTIYIKPEEYKELIKSLEMIN